MYPILIRICEQQAWTVYFRDSKNMNKLTSEMLNLTVWIWIFKLSVAIITVFVIQRKWKDKTKRNISKGKVFKARYRYRPNCFFLSVFCAVYLVDIWDGANDEPVIYHGYTLTSKILVKDVLHAVRDYAFVKSPCVIKFSLPFTV